MLSFHIAHATVTSFLLTALFKTIFTYLVFVNLPTCGKFGKNCIHFISLKVYDIV